MELITTYICKKGDIGVHDNMFGGTIMSLVDDAGASYAAQICDTQRIVTIKINEMVFKKPVKVETDEEIMERIKSEFSKYLIDYEDHELMEYFFPTE